MKILASIKSMSHLEAIGLSRSEDSDNLNVKISVEMMES